jgi:hypothetical protein
MPALRDGPSISHVAIQTRGKVEPRATSTLGNDGNSEVIGYLLLRDLDPINVCRLAQTENRTGAAGYEFCRRVSRDFVG